MASPTQPISIRILSFTSDTPGFIGATLLLTTLKRLQRGLICFAFGHHVVALAMAL